MQPLMGIESDETPTKKEGIIREDSLMEMGAYDKKTS